MKKIQVLGPGCSRCNTLAKRAEEAARDLGIEYEFEKVTDIDRITGFGVMVTPVLVIDGDVKSPGKVFSVEEIKDMLE